MLEIILFYTQKLKYVRKIHLEFNDLICHETEMKDSKWPTERLQYFQEASSVNIVDNSVTIAAVPSVKELLFHSKSSIDMVDLFERYIFNVPFIVEKNLFHSFLDLDDFESN